MAEKKEGVSAQSWQVAFDEFCVNDTEYTREDAKNRGAHLRQMFENLRNHFIKQGEIPEDLFMLLEKVDVQISLTRFMLYKLTEEK